MKNLQLFFSLLGFSVAVLLTGCAGSFGFPDSGAISGPISQVSPGGFSGKNLGGHAPIVGAHVYLLQIGTGGYGTGTTSLLTNAALATGSYGTAGGTDTTIVGTSTTPAYYVTTNGAGYFSVTGDYTCTPGLPVYLYAYGGAPDTNPAVGIANITSATGNGTTTTFTVNNEKFYVGQSVVFSGIPTSNPWVALNGTTQTVTAISTTGNTSFSIASTVNATSSNFGTISNAGPVGVFNPGIVNMALLGNCPTPFAITAVPTASGSFTLTGISASDIAKLSVGDLIQGPGIQTGGTTITVVGTNSITVAAADTGGNGTTSYTYAVGGGNFSATGGAPVNFVYMNEVATAATAFVLAPFSYTTNTATAASVYPTYGTGGNVYIASGNPTSRTFAIPAATAATLNVGSGNIVTTVAATGDTLALTAVQNAANNFKQLYDITGQASATASSSICQNNSTPQYSTDGENHTACTGIINNGSGGAYGIVPNALINTMGNILAACVDSANLFGLGASSGTPSSACNTLFLNATFAGTTATSLTAGGVPNNIASAAVMMALHPESNVGTLFSLQNGVVPFTPALSAAPNDFAIGINIYQNTSNSFLGGGPVPNGIAVDASGNAIVTTTGCTNGCIMQITPKQVAALSPIAYGPGAFGVAISPDSTPKVWVSNSTNTTTATGIAAGTYYEAPEPFTATSFTGYSKGGGTTPMTYFASPTSVAVDGAGNAYFADHGDTDVYEVTAPGAVPTVHNATYLTVACNANLTTPTSTINAIAIDSKANGYNIWTSTSGQAIPLGFCEQSQSGTVLMQQGQAGSGNWNGIAIDANDAGWVTSDTAGLYQFPSGNGYDTQIFTLTGNGVISGAHGVAIDGQDNVWVANKNGNTVTNDLNTGTAQNNVSGTQSTTTVAAPGTSGGGYQASGTINAPVGIALDPSGDVWVINTGTIVPTGTLIGTSGAYTAPTVPSGGSVTEIIGIAPPTYLPLSAAALNNSIGLKP